MKTLSWTEKRDSIGMRMKYCGLGTIMGSLVIYLLFTVFAGFPVREGLALSFVWIFPGAILSLLYFLHVEDTRSGIQHFLLGSFAPIAFFYLIIWPVLKLLRALLRDIKEEIQAFYRIWFVKV